MWRTITAVKDAHGHISHFVGSFSDITALKQAEKILLKARARLEKQVVTTQEKLKESRTETDAINTALDVLLKHQGKDLVKTKISLNNEVEAVVMPLLKRLKARPTVKCKHFG